MNPTTASAKPKAKFSSRNLSAVFKAPLRTKPLPDNAIQRPNNRMLVLGRAAVAAPAPLNTLSLKRESQVPDTHVSLVLASSNWAEQQKLKEDETPEHSPAPVDVVTSEKIWTPESVAEHLRTVPVRPKVVVESSGRWGDDAVEDDIVQNNIRRQMQKEQEFPDLNNSVEEAQTQGQAPLVDRSPSLNPQQSEQHHGRATGRWAHFNEKEEMHRPMQDDRWSRDRWSRDRYSRDDDDSWSRDHYARYDDDNQRERQSYESSNNAVSPVPNDSRTHFSRSDARFDMLASGDQDRVLSHSPHRMDWSSGRFGRRDGRSSSPTPMNDHTPHAGRSLTQSPASASSSPASKTPPMTPARAMPWRNLSSQDQGSDCAQGAPRRAANAWSKDEVPSTPVAEAADSSTESASNSFASNSSSPPQQVQLLKRPKMLFDPKTGVMVDAKEKANPAKRQAGGRHGGEGRESTKASTKRNYGKPEVVAQTVKTAPAAIEGVASAATVIAVNSVEETAVDDKASVSKISSSVSSNAVLAEPSADNVEDKGLSKERNHKRVPKRAKQFAQQEAGSQLTKFTRDSTFRAATQQAQQRRGSQGVNNGKATEHGMRNLSIRNDRGRAGSSKPAQRRSSRKVEVTTLQPSKVDPSEVAVLELIADSSSGGVVVVTDDQEGIKVNTEDDGFETVKSRRAVLTEKKQLRQRLASTEAAAPVPDSEKKTTRGVVEEHVEEQSKGEQVQETLGLAPKAVHAQPASKPRGKTTNPRRSGDQPTKDWKSKSKQPKQSARASGAKTKEYKQKAADAKLPVSSTKPTEQVAGEAPAELPVSKKRVQYVKVESVMETKREQKPRRENHPQGSSARKSNERKTSSSSTAGNSHKQQETTKRVVEKMSTKSRGSAAKAKPKQVRQVYVVKTPSSTATSTAA